jgi:hypothetical protein
MCLMYGERLFRLEIHPKDMQRNEIEAFIHLLRCARIEYLPNISYTGSVSKGKAVEMLYFLWARTTLPDVLEELVGEFVN